MKKSGLMFTYISNVVCFLLLLVMLGSQFLPFWLCEECKTHEESKVVSIAEYTWFAKKHTPITKGMTSVYLNIYGQDYKDEDGKAYKFQANDTVIPCVIVFAACILSVIVLIKNPGSPLMPIFPLAGGVGGFVGYLTIAALQAGQNWQLHLIVAIVLTVASGGTLLYYLIKYFKSISRTKSN